MSNKYNRSRGKTREVPLIKKTQIEQDTVSKNERHTVKHLWNAFCDMNNIPKGFGRNILGTGAIFVLLLGIVGGVVEITDKINTAAQISETTISSSESLLITQNEFALDSEESVESGSEMIREFDHDANQSTKETEALHKILEEDKNSDYFPEWASAYIYALNLFQNRHQICNYLLYDIDRNGIPELLISEGSKYKFVFTFENGKLVLLGDILNELYRNIKRNELHNATEEVGIISYGSTGTGLESLLLVTIENGTLAKEFICGSFWPPDDESFFYNSDGEIESDEYEIIVKEWTFAPLPLRRFNPDEINELTITIMGHTY